MSYTLQIHTYTSSCTLDVCSSKRNNVWYYEKMYPTHNRARARVPLRTRITSLHTVHSSFRLPLQYSGKQDNQTTGCQANHRLLTDKFIQFFWLRFCRWFGIVLLVRNIGKSAAICPVNTETSKLNHEQNAHGGNNPDTGNSGYCEHKYVLFEV